MIALSFETLEALFSDPETLKTLGNDILIAGLVGDIVVLFVPSSRKVLEKCLAVFFIALIIAGIAIERFADTKIEIAQSRAHSDELNTLRAQMGWRQINELGFKTALEGKAKAPVEILFLKGNSEAYSLAFQIHRALLSAQWDASDPKPVPAEELAKSIPRPTAISDAPPEGITVTFRVETPEEKVSFARFEMFLRLGRPEPVPLSNLLSAITGSMAGGGAARWQAAYPSQVDAPRSGVLRLIIGPKT